MIFLQAGHCGANPNEKCCHTFCVLSGLFLPCHSRTTSLHHFHVVLQAGDYEANPTCNWYYQEGVKVLDSQGFTCECGFGNIWDQTIGDSVIRT